MKYLWMLVILLLVGGLLVTAQEVTPEATPEVTIAPESTTVVISELLGLQIEAPVSFTLPEGWSLVLRDTYIYRDVVEDADGPLETVPIDVYAGPLSSGTKGWIVVVWGFDSIVVTEITGQEDFDTRSAWLDGLRMLQLVVFDPRCNMGTAPQRDYSVGGLPAIGATFNVVDCPLGIPDTRGWFASLKVEGLNFAFYMYVDPLQPAGSLTEFELQAILDTADFTVDEIIITQPEFEATRNAFVETQIAPTQTP
jgi:hypothetical protein